MKRRFLPTTRLSFDLASAILACLALTSTATHAVDRYWDGNNTASGFGTASGSWLAPTPGPTPGWGAANGTTAVASVTTTTSDALFFGNGATGLAAGTITVGTVSAGNFTFATGSGAIVLSSGTITLAAAQTTTVNNATNTINSVLAGAATSFTKAGTGTLILTGDNTYTGTTTISAGTLILTGANAYTGTTTISAGTLNLGGGSATGSLASTVLTLGGGVFNYTRTGNTTQGLTTTNINAGPASAISVVSGNTLNLGTVVRGTGGVLDFSTTGAGTVTALPTSNVGGIMPGFTTGNSWAVANGAGVAISGLSSYTLTSVAGTTAASYLNGNIDVDSSAGALDAAIIANSLRFSAAASNTMTLTGTSNVITSGGILVGSGVGNNLSTITGGTLAGAASKDLSVIQNNTLNGLTISSIIANNTGATALTKSGAGLVTLANSNTFTGGLIMNSGKVVLGNVGALNNTAGSENAVTFTAGSTGTLALNGNSVVLRSVDSSAVNLGSATIENASAAPATLTIGNSTNAASTYAGVIRDGVGGGALTLVKSGTGNLNLSNGANTFSGGILMNAGTLTFNSDNNLGAFGAGNGITFNNSAALSPGSTVFARDITINPGVTATFDGGGSSNSGNLTGTGGIAISNAFGSQHSFSGTGNTFQGSVNIGAVSGTGGQAYRATFASLADSPGANGRIIFSASSVTHANGSVFEYTGDTNLLLANRQLEIASTGSTPTNGHQIRSSGTGTLTINTDLIVTSTTAQTLTLTGVNTGNNTFSSSITNGSSSALSLSKTGAGTWNLSGPNTYSGATTITVGVLRIKNNSALGSTTGGTTQSGTSALEIDGSGGAVIVGAEALSINGGGITNFGALRNIAGDNTYGGTVTMAAQSRINSDSGTLLLNNATAVTGAFNLVVGGAGNTTISGAMTNGTGGVIKDGAGTLVLSGTNTFTGGTAVNAGTLQLDYTTLDTTKLSDTGVLTLGGGTLDLKGGTTHTEIVASTSLTASKSSNVTRSTPGAVLQMGAITRGAGAFVDFSSDSIATTATLNANGILGGWATVGGTNWATNSTDGLNGPITAYTGYTDVTRQTAGTIADGATTNVRIIEGSGTNAIALGAATTTINSLNQSTTGGSSAATIDPAGQTLRVNSILVGTGAGALTIGNGTNNGVLGTATAGGELILINNSANGFTINSVVADNTTASSLTKSGPGPLTLTGVNTYTGATTIGAGTLNANSTDALGSGIATNTLIFTGGTLQAGGTITSPATRGVTMTSTGLIDTNNNAVSIAGIMTGTLGMTKSGPGTLTLTGASTYTGTTSVKDGTLLLDTGANRLAAAGSVVLGDTVTTGKLVLGGTTAANQTVASLTTTGLGGSVVGGFSSDSTLTVSPTAASTFGGTLGGAGLNENNLALTKAGTSALILSSANTYTGATAITAGALLVTANDALGSNAAGTTVTAGAALGLSGNISYSTTELVSGSGDGGTGGIAGAIPVGSRGFIQSVSGNNTFAGPIQLSAAGTSRIGTQDGASLTLSGAITQATGISTANILFRVGNTAGDFVTLTNAGNSFGGDSTVFTGATLGYAGVRLGVTNALPTNLTITSFGGTNANYTALDLSGFDQTLNGLATGSGTGALQIINTNTGTPSTLTLNPTVDKASSNTLVVGGGALGVINVVKNGAFTQTLSGRNSYSGSTTLNQGNLTLAFSPAVTSDILPTSSALTLGGGTLQLTGTGTQTLAGLTTNANTVSRILLGANQTLTLGALTSAGAGSSLNFNTAAGGANATSPEVGTGTVVLTGQTPGTAINSGFTVSDAGGFGLATVNGSNQVVRLTTTTLLPASGATSATDYRVDNNAGGAAANGSSSLAVTTSQLAKSITVDTTTANGVLTLDPGVQLGNNIWHFGGIGSNTYQITGGAGLTSVASNETIALNNYNTGLVTINSAILANGINALTVIGTGTTVLTGTNTYSGATTIAGGMVNANASAALGDGSASNTLILTGSTLQAGGTINSPATRPVSIEGTVAIDTNNNPVSIAGIISGTGALIKNGAGILTLSGANTYSGATTVTVGTLQIGATNALPTASAVTLSGTSTLDLFGNNQAIGSFASVTGNTITNTAPGTGTNTLTINPPTPGAVTIAALVTDGATAQTALRVANNNAGSQITTNSANSFTGGLILANPASSAGTRLQVGTITGTPWGTGPITVGEAATDKAGIFFNTANQTLANPVISNTGLGTDRVGTYRLDVTGTVLSGQQTANLAPVTFGTNGTGGVTVTGKITGPEGLTLLASSLGGTALTVTLNNAANDYQGDTRINENAQVGKSFTLALGANDQIPNGAAKGNVSITTNGTGVGTLNLAGFSDTINGLSGNGTVEGATTGTPTNTLTLGDNDATANFSGVIKNTAVGSTLNLVKTGTGTQTLGGANTYTGATTIAGGTLALDASGSLASSQIALNGGNYNVSAVSGYTLGASQSLTGSGTVTGAIGINGTLAIGNPPGTMTFTNDLGLNAGSISNFEINGFNPGEFDLAKAAAGSQTVTFNGGTLNLLFTSGFSTAGTVKIFDFGNYAGSGFTTINPTGLASGYTASFNSANGLVTVIPEPRAALLGALGLLALLRRRRN